MLYVKSHQLFQPSKRRRCMKLKEIVDSGEIGEIYKGKRCPWKIAGGGPLDLALTSVSFRLHTRMLGRL